MQSGQQSVTPARAMQIALEHHRAGRLAEAESIYRQVLDLDPRNAEAWHLLGVIAHQAGKQETAIELIGKALAIRPDLAEAHSNLGLALMAGGRPDDAAASHRRAISFKPDYATAHNNLGNVLNAQRKLDEAALSYLAAIAFQPDYAAAHCHLGNVFQDQGRLDDAVASYRRALSFRPDFAEAHSNLGNALQEQGRLDEAMAGYRAALSLKPDLVEALSNLGNVLQAQDRLDEAVASYRQALLLKPDFAEAHSNLGLALEEQGHLHDGQACYLRALALKPDYAEAHYNLGNALKKQDKPDEAVASYLRALAVRPDYAQAHNNLGLACMDRGAPEEAIACYRKALAIKPDFVGAYDNLLIAMQFSRAPSPADRLAEHRRFADRYEAPLLPHRRAHRNTREPERRMKIGYVSADFRRHAVAYFIEPVLARHDRDQVDVFCYCNSARHDEFTGRIAALADHWLVCKRMSDENLAERIRADGIDILVDLSGHTAGNRLPVFARKPAPVQITYLGYPGSSGLAGMDYRLTDGLADPEGSEANYSEALLRLPHSLCCYRPAGDMPGISPLPALHNGCITFGSFNNVNKIDEPCVDLWAALLRALPDARLLMLTVPEGQTRERLAAMFAARGVAAARIEFHGWLSRADFHRMFLRADIALDPIAVTGGTTTCESLWMGLPVIVLAGERFISRVGCSFLQTAGVPEFAASSQEDYIGIARRLAGDLPRLAEIRAGLRAKLAASPLMDEAGFTRDLEKIYRNVWRAWCDPAQKGRA